jgi:hypothetical protein
MVALPTLLATAALHAVYRLIASRCDSDHPPSQLPPAERSGNSLFDIEIEWLLLEDQFS